MITVGLLFARNNVETWASGEGARTFQTVEEAQAALSDELAKPDLGWGEFPEGAYFFDTVRRNRVEYRDIEFCPAVVTFLEV